jgi:hypothetical protein
VVADTSAILRAFADLTPTTRTSGLDVTAGGQPLAWLGVRSSLVGRRSERSMVAGHAARVQPDIPMRVGRDHRLDRLAAIDALHEHERLLREGWVYVVGTAEIDGERRRVCHPLMSRPVVLRRALASQTVVPAGDLEITALISDVDSGLRLEEAAQFGGGALQASPPPDPALLQRLDQLVSWINRTAIAAGLPVEQVVAWDRPPERWRDAGHLVAVVGAGLHLSRDVDRPGFGDVLRAWARVPGTARTAFGELYAATAAPAVFAPGEHQAIRSPLPLSDAQRAVLRRARGEPVVAVSGAPGNGKSHVVAAAAIDAVARGESVLIATPSRYAADVIGDLLYRQAGPDPVLFGSSAGRRDLAADLADGAAAMAQTAMADVIAADERARERVAEVEHDIASLLAVEASAAQMARWEPMLPGLSRMAPGIFAADADLDAVAAGIADVERGTIGWFAGWRARLARRRLSAATGAVEPLDLTRLRRALEAARARRAAAELAVIGGTRVGALWDELFAADTAAAEAFGTRLQAQARHGRIADRDRMRAVAGLAAALRSGRASRREQLRRLDGGALTAALPLWVGALTDVDDLLPPEPRLFDLVILDEASQIDQPRAAPALLRARRAMIVGDPRQLRHVSFVSDADQRRALDEHGLTERAAVLDVRRVSAFDAAAAATAVSFLGEHHRSVPHLIAFSDRRFYGGQISVRTRHPANESVDAIRLVDVVGATLDGGVNRAEITAVAIEVQRLAAAGVTSIGVVSPFRAQADALEAMLLDRFDVDEIDRLGLRVGTVHAFQGAERDVMVVSLGLTADDAEQRRRFVEDPHLCNVMVTRARQRMVIVTSLRDAGDGILSDLLAHAQRPPDPLPLEPPSSPWVASVAAELQRQGCAVRCGYRVGDEVLDLVAGAGGDAHAVDCRVRPGGVAAHLASRRGLHRTGWRVAEAWASHYDGDAVRAAVEVGVTVSMTRRDPT